jgi:DNA-binding NarL/FixJ family response regulator
MGRPITHGGRHTGRSSAIRVKREREGFPLRCVAMGNSDLEAGEENSGRPRQAQRQLAELIPRELDVIRLIACGLSNHEIAAELIVSERTAKTYVAHVLQKTPPP